MTKKVQIEDIREQLDHYARLELAGASKRLPVVSLGPPVALWRKYRDGSETWEVLPRWIAKLVLGAIPAEEPEVARARLLRHAPVLRSAGRQWLAPKMNGNHIVMAA